MDRHGLNCNFEGGGNCNCGVDITPPPTPGYMAHSNQTCGALRARAEKAETERDLLLKDPKNRLGAYRELVVKVMAADVERDEWRYEYLAMKKYLCNLLARIHRDGGHYIEKHGLNRAVADAHDVWEQLRLQLDVAQNERKKLAKAKVRVLDICDNVTMQCAIDQSLKGSVTDQKTAEACVKAREQVVDRIRVAIQADNGCPGCEGGWPMDEAGVHLLPPSRDNIMCLDRLRKP